MGVSLSFGAHEARADGGDADALVAEFGMKALGVANEGELAGDVREHVRHGEFAADAGDVDDRRLAVGGVALEQVRKSGIGGVERSEEVGGHSALVGFYGLIFNGTDFNDASVVDEDVDVAEEADGVVDERGCLFGVGEIGGEQENIVRMLDGFVCEEGVAGVGQFVGVSGDQDEFCSGTAVAVCESETQAAGAAGDEYDTAAVALWGTQYGAGSGDGANSSDGADSGNSGDDLRGVKRGSGGLHSFR